MATVDVRNDNPTATRRHEEDREFLVQHATETRRSLATSEFWAFVVVAAILLIAGYTDSGFDVEHAWTLVAAVTIGYLLSRGIAKAGSKEPYVRSLDRA